MIASWNRAVAAVDRLSGTELEDSTKWIDEVPYSFLIWTEIVALLEPYDYGRPQKPTEAARVIANKRRKKPTLSGHAPLLLVWPDAPYHCTLRDGFERVFNEQVAHVHPATTEEVKAAVDSVAASRSETRRTEATTEPSNLRPPSSGPRRT